VTYLIVGIDRRTLVPWQRNVRGHDPASATSAALERAGADAVLTLDQLCRRFAAPAS